MSKTTTRRSFLGTVLTAGQVLQSARPGSVWAKSTSSPEHKPAVLGGSPVRTESFPSWPKIGENDRRAWEQVLERGLWCRLGAQNAKRFEEKWAETLQARYCLVTSSGTTALHTSLNALDIGPGDEVLVPPYTFVATINVVFLQYALPVFVDTDRETFQIDAGKLEAAITPRTKAILPVHLGGGSADMDKILEIAKRRRLAVLEDACQSHLAEWRNRKVGTLGDLGCFSFQGSKNLNSGEGGSIVSNNQELIERCRSFHNNGRGPSNGAFEYIRNGTNHRMTEFQATLLLEQLTRLEEQARVREQNARYLDEELRKIAGVIPARSYPGCTRNAYHLYLFRYQKEHFAELPRAAFLKALQAEGIPCSGGYRPLNKEPFIAAAAEARGFQQLFSAAELAQYQERSRHCPENDRLCEEAVWLFQTMLLGTRQDMNQILEAIQKIQKHASELART
ncbi:MAG: DegT/DnrJ/EryC1/StrS family aminotransferase [Acidobacteriota bacterium]